MSDQIDDRKSKLAKVRELGADPYGSRFTGVTGNAAIREFGEKADIQPGQVVETADATVRAAGRVHLLRDTGKLIFITVRDWTGDLQWALSKKGIEEATKPRSHEATKGEMPFPAGATAWQVAKML